MILSIEIPESDITRLLEGHRGTYSGWLHTATGNVLEGYHVHFDKETDEEGAGTGRLHISHDAIKAGLQLMAMQSPLPFSQWMDENDDDLCFDVAWQFIVFGKLVYA